MFSAAQILRSRKPCAVTVRGEKLENHSMFSGSVQFCSERLNQVRLAPKFSRPKPIAKYVPILVIAPPSY